jgi:hypothetical protein
MRCRLIFSSDFPGAIFQRLCRGNFICPPHTKTIAALVHRPGDLFHLRMHGCMSDLGERPGSRAIASAALLAETSPSPGMTSLVSISK